jgi:hypothetical protein
MALTLVEVGLLITVMSWIGYMSFTKWNRPYLPTRFDRGDVMAGAVGMAIGLVLIVVGIVYGLGQWIFG